MTGVEKQKTDKAISEKRDIDDYLYTDKSIAYKSNIQSPRRTAMDFLSYNNGDILMPNANKKAIPLTHNHELKSENIETDSDSLEDEDSIENEIHDDNITEEQSPVDDYYEEDSLNNKISRYLLPSSFIALAIGWTSFFIWANFETIKSGITPSEIPSLIMNWSVPTILIAVGWLLFMRSSKAEAQKFGDVANHLNRQANEVQDKMREVNEDIALARDFLSQYSRDIEHIGRNSAQNITDAAKTLEIAFNDSEIKAEKLEQVSNNANSNLELLRKNLPVVNSAAKDATNMLGKAGIEAKEQMQSLKTAMDQSIESVQTSKAELEALSRSNKDVTDNIRKQSEGIKSFTNEMVETSQANAQTIGESLRDEYEGFNNKIDETIESLNLQTSQISESINSKIADLNEALAQLKNSNSSENEHIDDMIEKVQSHITQSEERLEILSTSASEKTAKMAFALTALNDNSANVGEGLANNHKQAELLIERTEKLLLALDSSSRELDETMPSAMKRMDEILTAIDLRFADTFENIGKISDLENSLSDKSIEIDGLIRAASEQIENLSTKQGDEFNTHTAKAKQLLETLEASKETIHHITNISDETFIQNINKINQHIDESAQHSREIISKNIEESKNQLAENSAAVIQEAAELQISQIRENLEISLNSHIEKASDAIGKLQGQLIEIQEMADNIEKRVIDTSREFSGVGDESFSRQMALLTESLNSTAIDVAKIISNDVTDNAWAAYLKGDRGVFTRRAVKLLTASEAKLIIAHYDDNIEFRDHVNRYIHDFEAMMRVLLSTRDGNAIGVTMLSSDVGKLYVALAQAIERLRK